MPIDVASGNVHIERDELFVPGKVPLVWERRFSNALAVSGANGPLGRGWTNRYFSTLTRHPDGFQFVSPAGSAELLPDIEQSVEAGSTVRNLGACIEIFLMDGRYVVQAWDVDDGSVWRYAFAPRPGAGPLRLAGIEDPAGHAVDLTWLDDRLQAVQQRLERRRLSFVHDRDGRIAQVTLESGGESHVIENCEYDAAGRLTAVLDAGGFADRFEHDGQHRIAREVVKDGGVFHYRYDSAGRCVYRSGLGHYDEKRLRYIEASRMTEVTDSHGAKTLYQAIGEGQIAHEWNALGVLHSKQYDKDGRLIGRVDSLGGVTRIGYDAMGNRNLLIDPMGAVTHWRFNTDHQLLGLVDANGQEWQRVLDAWGQQVRTIDPLGHGWTLAYDDAGNVRELTDPMGAVKRQTFEDGVLRTITEWNGGVRHFRFDAFGRVVERVDPTGAITSIQYDRLGRPIRITHPDGSQIIAAWDIAGNLTTYVDANGHRRRWRYGPCGRMLERHDPVGGVVRYVWDSEPGRLLEVINQKGERQRMIRDACGRVVSEVSFDGAERSFIYNGEDRPIGHTNAAGETISLERDACQRVIRQRLSDGDDTRFEHDPMGRLKAAINAHAALTVERDALGRIVSESQGGHTVHSRYDALGRIIATDTSLGHHVAFEHDASGQLTEVRTLGQQTRLHYDARGLEVTREMPGDTRLTQNHDLLGRLTEQRVGSPAAHRSAVHQTLAQRSFRHDPGGQLIQRLDARWGDTAYAYDPAERLIETLDSAQGRQALSYDETHNIVLRTSDADEEHRHIGPGDRLLQQGDATWLHDAEGRLIERVDRPGELPWRFEWDALDRLRAVTRADGKRWCYLYDALSRRIGKRGAEDEPQTQRTYIWDKHRMIHELGADAPRSTWVYGGDRHTPLLTIQRGRVYSIVCDAIGTPTELIDDDGNLALAVHRRPWGRVDREVRPSADTVECPIGFQGQWNDSESGLSYQRFRYYSPDAGRYLSQDALRLMGGINFYAYCRNPVNWIDILALSCQSDSAKRGRDAAEKDLIAAGHTIVSEEVTMVVNGKRIRADFVTEDPQGNTHVVEVKNGAGRLTENQAGSGVFDMNSPANSSPHPGGTIDTSGGTTTTYTSSTGNAAKTTDVGLPAKGSSGTATFSVLHYDE